MTVVEVAKAGSYLMVVVADSGAGGGRYMRELRIEGMRRTRLSLI